MVEHNHTGDWKDIEYFAGFGNHVETEAEKGALPHG